MWSGIVQVWAPYRDSTTWCSKNRPIYVHLASTISNSCLFDSQYGKLTETRHPNLIPHSRL